MIIGINGYIGSGKDTVGKIIQYLDLMKFTGETPDAQEFKYWYIDKNHNIENSKWKIKKFAGKLKEIASLMTGIPMENFENQEFKKEILGEEWAKYSKSVKVNFGDSKSFEIDRKEYLELLVDEKWSVSRSAMTVRDFLQKLGTEAIRNGLHTNAWVNALFADYYQTSLVAKDDKYLPKWIITDVRFPNEAQAIKDKGGIVVRVVRDKTITGSYMIGESGFKRISGHPSETSLDDWDFDHIIRNEGSLEELVSETSRNLKELI